MMETTLIYDFTVEVVESPTQYVVDDFCNSIVVRNTGAAGTTVNFRGMILAVNESFTMGGNRGEILRGRIDINLAGAGAQATITEKFYTDGCSDILQKLQR
jgi:hypothetical protein